MKQIQRGLRLWPVHFVMALVWLMPPALRQFDLVPAPWDDLTWFLQMPPILWLVYLDGLRGARIAAVATVLTALPLEAPECLTAGCEASSLALIVISISSTISTGFLAGHLQEQFRRRIALLQGLFDLATELHAAEDSGAMQTRLVLALRRLGLSVALLVPARDNRDAMECPLTTDPQAEAASRRAMESVGFLYPALRRGEAQDLPGDLHAEPFMVSGTFRGVLVFRAAASGDRRLYPAVPALLGAATGHWSRLRTAMEASLHDELTGLPNRRTFDMVLPEMLARARERGEPVSLLLLDVDGFKQVNDTQGHLAGDRLLRGVGAALQRVIRSQDLVCRWGGDEFAICLPGVDPEQARQVADRARAAVLAETAGIGQQGPITLSMGIAVDHGPGTTPVQLLTEADQALYRAKAEGRDRACLAV